MIKNGNEIQDIDFMTHFLSESGISAILLMVGNLTNPTNVSVENDHQGHL